MYSIRSQQPVKNKHKLTDVTIRLIVPLATFSLALSRRSPDMAASRFGVVDYVVFAAMLLVSAAIGIFYGCLGGKQKTTKEYLLGDRNMLTWPVAFSLMASFLSAITLLGVPAEVYTFGIQYVVLVFFSYLLLLSVVHVLYVPMIHRVRITSAYEYLEMRFSVGVRILGSILFIVLTIFYLSVVLYAPSLALQAVAGVPLEASIVITVAVCTFYTSLGGLKAVIWTDVFQSVVMLAGLITICVVGTQSVGGFQSVIDINREMGRLKVFDFNPDPTIRNTFWSLTIGGALSAMPAWTVNQGAVQRYLAVKSVKLARRAVWINLPFLVLLASLCCLDGLVIYAVYYTCDLRIDKKIQSNDQVLPFFVIDKLGHLTGVTGLFAACIFAGALSTASSGLNALSLVILLDIVKKRFPDLTDLQSSKICKIISVVLGCILIGGTFFVQYTGTLVLQLAYSIGGIVGGPLIGIFTMGMLISRTNSKGVYVGALCGIGTTIWLFVGAQLYPPFPNPAPVSLKQCPSATLNGTKAPLTNESTLHFPNPNVDDSSFTRFYSISYLWYCGIGITVTVLFGTLASLLWECTRKEERDPVDPKLIFPVKAWLVSFLPNKWHTWNANTGLPVSEDRGDWGEDWMDLAATGLPPTEDLERSATSRSYGKGMDNATHTAE